MRPERQKARSVQGRKPPGLVHLSEESGEMSFTERGGSVPHMSTFGIRRLQVFLNYYSRGAQEKKANVRKSVENTKGKCRSRVEEEDMRVRQNRWNGN